MELVLLEDVKKLGHKGDVIQVRDGYARNFLIPRGFALAATRANQEFVGEQKVRAEKREAKRRQEAAERAQKLEKLKVTVESAAGDQDKLFGSVTSEDIAKVLALQGYEFDKKKIALQKPIRTLGSHSVTVEVYPQVKSTLTVEVIRKAE